MFQVELATIGYACMSIICIALAWWRVGRDGFTPRSDLLFVGIIFVGLVLFTGTYAVTSEHNPTNLGHALAGIVGIAGVFPALVPLVFRALPTVAPNKGYRP